MKLIDIVVDEVSLVDKAANKRVFAIVKRADPEPEPEKKEDKGFTETELKMLADAKQVLDGLAEDIKKI